MVRSVRSCPRLNVAMTTLIRGRLCHSPSANNNRLIERKRRARRSLVAVELTDQTRHHPNVIVPQLIEDREAEYTGRYGHGIAQIVLTSSELLVCRHLVQRAKIVLRLSAARLEIFDQLIASRGAEDGEVFIG